MYKKNLSLKYIYDKLWKIQLVSDKLIERDDVRLFGKRAKLRMKSVSLSNCQGTYININEF